jgi:hypothetical protein
MASVGTINSIVALKFMSGWKAKTKLAAMYAVGSMAEKAWAFCDKMLSLDDHTLSELTALDHPYAKRWGPEGSGLHDPFQQVHEQTGELRAGLKTRPPSADAMGARASVYNDSETDPLIQIGTQTMIARPYMAYVKSANAEEILAAGAEEFQKRFAAKEAVA